MEETSLRVTARESPGRRGGSTAPTAKGPSWSGVPSLAVYGNHPAEVASSIGGWLCDLTLAGWDVTATVKNKADDRPLRILGVDTVFDATLPPTFSGVAPEMVGPLAISSALVRDAANLGVDLSGVLRVSPHTCLWGEITEVPPSMLLRPGRYRPSAAALAFKKHAVMAAGKGFSVAGSERMLHLRSSASSPRPVQQTWDHAQGWRASAVDFCRG